MIDETIVRTVKDCEHYRHSLQSYEDVKGMKILMAVVEQLI